LAQNSALQDKSVYLPSVIREYYSPETLPRINSPQFPANSNIPKDYFNQTAIVWFGQVTPSKSYTDIYVGYNNNFLFVYLAIIDRLL